MENLDKLHLSLKAAKNLAEKSQILTEWPEVKAFLAQENYPKTLLNRSLEERAALLAVIAIGQAGIVLRAPEKVLPHLVLIDRFYGSIGGIVGYHVTALKMMAKRPLVQKTRKFKSPPGVDITTDSQAKWEGIQALDQIGELYPLGGVGARLKLRSPEGEPLPVALLPFCGRSLLEGLIRDVQAREYLYYKCFSKQILTPVAMMSSLERENHRSIETLLTEKEWFGRPEESFFLFPQLSVPVLTRDGDWSMLAEDRLNLYPGGHGAVWKTAEEEGVFDWFLDWGKEQLLIRQINNPIGGVDHGLLSLIGVGKREGKAFGFASCMRAVHAAEGVLVEVEEESGQRAISNIEYTHFAHHGIEDKSSDDGYSLYPANTNILYVDLPKLLPTIQQKPLPALHINMKDKVPFLSATGERSEIEGGRLESMMQNISDRLTTGCGAILPTFVTYNERLKTISVTKKCAQRGESLFETPEGAFQDLMRNGYDLLKNHCQMELSPSTLFLYHPSLGPLYEIISQKIRGGEIMEGGELQLEIAELLLDHLKLEGTLLIEAKNPCGHLEGRLLRYSDRCGKCRLSNVAVRNRGIDREAENVYWKNQISRHEALKIVLLGSGEFEAEETAFVGNQTIVVPDGERWMFLGDEIVKESIEEPTWQWRYRWDGERIRLDLASHILSLQGR